MPKIPSLMDAEQQLVILEDVKLAPLRDERALVINRLATLDAQINDALAPLTATLDAAKDEQARTLTRWIQSAGHNSRSATRYALRLTGPSDKCWDSRAWLRVMKHGGDIRANERWWWTLDIKPANHHNSQVCLDPRKKDPAAPAPILEAMLEAADQALVAAGFILTDLDNEPPTIG